MRSSQLDKFNFETIKSFGEFIPRTYSNSARQSLAVIAQQYLQRVLTKLNFTVHKWYLSATTCRGFFRPSIEAITELPPRSSGLSLVINRALENFKH